MLIKKETKLFVRNASLYILLSKIFIENNPAVSISFFYLFGGMLTIPKASLPYIIRKSFVMNTDSDMSVNVINLSIHNYEYRIMHLSKSAQCETKSKTRTLAPMKGII